MIKHTTGALWVLILLAGPATAHGAQSAGDSTETIFDGAKKYTVQIRTAVPRAFDPDIKGVFRGAGFIVDAKRGWVMTNAHVAAYSPSHVEVALYGKRYEVARKVYVDPHLDLAILEIPHASGAMLGQASLDCDNPPKVGHPVGAFGHPWNLPYTGTRGIISGVALRQDSEMLQTDTPINGGNSGGPLISLTTGRVVGINTAQIRGSQNTNFAVPMKYACQVLRLLREGKNPSPPDMRVIWYQSDEAEHKLKVARTLGDGFGLMPGDEIVRVGGQSARIQNESQLDFALRGIAGRASLVVRREGKEITLTGKASPSGNLATTRGLVYGGVLFGLNPLIDANEVNTGPVVVQGVDRGSDGDAKEFARGDFLDSVNGEPVRGLDDLYRKLSSAPGTIVLSIKRYGGGTQAFVYLERTLNASKVEWVLN